MICIYYYLITVENIKFLAPKHLSQNSVILVFLEINYQVKILYKAYLSILVYKLLESDEKNETFTCTPVPGRYKNNFRSRKSFFFVPSEQVIRLKHDLPQACYSNPLLIINCTEKWGRKYTSLSYNGARTVYRYRQWFDLSVADKFMTDSSANLASQREQSKPVDPIIDLFLHTGKKHSFSNGPSLSSPG